MKQSENKHWLVIRDVLVFQVKLLADGLRDLIISPISLGAALLGLLLERDKPDLYFQRVLGLGRRSERWINLFGNHAIRRRSQSGQLPANLDELFQKVEQGIRDQYGNDKDSYGTTEAIEKALSNLQAKFIRDKKRKASDQD